MKKRRRPKLGQHFLADSGYRRRVVEALPLLPEDLVIEIGAGGGAMTELLAGRTRKVIAIELDASAVRALECRFQAHPRIEVLQADILSSDFAALCRQYGAPHCFAFGNLPYYITSPILHRLFDFRQSIRAMGLVVQREVAQRIVAAPGRRSYGYLSVLAQLGSTPRIAFEIPPGAFSPPPKVRSALVLFDMRPKYTELSEAERASFLEFVGRCFARKRKNLMNNLSAACGRPRIEAALLELGWPHTVRAEQLTVEQFSALFHLVQ